jgi:hypothetical protein
MEFTVVRSQWYRGQGDTDSRLRRSSDGLMCCLGFHAIACGLDEADITGLAFPSVTRIPHTVPSGLLSWLWDADEETYDTPEAVIGRINDETQIPEDEREIRLTAEFAKHGITVKFVD